MFKRKIVFSLLISLVLFANLFAQDISSGKKLIRDEQYSQAKKYFQSMLSSPTSAEAYFNLGQIYFILGDIDSAKISYSKGIKSDEEFALNYAGMFKLNIAENNTVEAEKNKTLAIDLSGNTDAEVYSVLSEAYSFPDANKNFVKALDLLNTGMGMKNKLLSIYLTAAKLYLANSNGTEAIRNAEDVLDIDPQNPEALTIKAKVYILIQNNNGALQLLTQAIQNDSSYSPAYRELAELNATLKDYSKAAEYYAKYIETSEITLEKQKRYASILYINKEYSKAINILEDVIKSDKNSSSSIRIIAYSYLRQENIEQSKYYFEQLFEIKNAEFLSTDYENYADLLSKTGDDSLAIDYLLKVIDLDSTRQDILAKMSVLYFKNKKWNGVIASLNRKDKLTAQEYFDLSKAYIFQGDGNISKALQILADKVQLEEEQMGKTRQVLLYYQSDLFLANNDAKKMVDAKVKATGSVESLLNPNQKDDWNLVKDNWSELLGSTISTEYGNADSSLSILISKAPNLATAYIWKARVKANFDPESENGLAKPFYEKFIELAQNEQDKFKKELIEAFSYLGYYYYLQNDNKKSKEYWQMVLSIEPDNMQATEVIKSLK